LGEKVRVPERIFPFSKIRTDARFAVYSDDEGLVSKHDRAGHAVRGLSAHLEFKPGSKARIYERTPDGWEMIL
jgi:hypothetical protein